MSFSKLIQKSLTPLMAANIAAMVGSGVWLVAQGYMSAVWPSALAMLFSPFLFPLLLVPAAMCAGIMHLFGAAYPRLAKVMAVLSVLYLVTAFAGYAIASFYLMAGALTTNLLAAGVYTVAAAIAPWTILAMKDRENLFFIGLVWMAEITAVIVLCTALSKGWNLSLSFYAFWCIMAGMTGVQALYEKVFLKKAPEAPVATPPTSSSP